MAGQWTLACLTQHGSTAALQLSRLGREREVERGEKGLQTCSIDVAKDAALEVHAEKTFMGFNALHARAKRLSYIHVHISVFSTRRKHIDKDT